MIQNNLRNLIVSAETIRGIRTDRRSEHSVENSFLSKDTLGRTEKEQEN